MHIRIVSVGRMKACPERDLADDYIARAARTGRSLGVRSVSSVEVEAGGGKAQEAEKLLSRAEPGRIVRLDERGELITSTELSRKLAAWRDGGDDVAFLIGGADGLDPSLESRADLSIAFGRVTWPHRLVRALIAEQIYRALSISANTPYHRE